MAIILWSATLGAGEVERKLVQQLRVGEPGRGSAALAARSWPAAVHTWHGIITYIKNTKMQQGNLTIAQMTACSLIYSEPLLFSSVYRRTICVASKLKVLPPMYLAGNESDLHLKSLNIRLPAPDSRGTVDDAVVRALVEDALRMGPEIAALPAGEVVVVVAPPSHASRC